MRPFHDKPLSKEDISNLQKLRDLIKAEKEKKTLSPDQQQTLRLLKNLYHNFVITDTNKENEPAPIKPSTRSRR